MRRGVYNPEASFGEESLYSASSLTELECILVVDSTSVAPGQPIHGRDSKGNYYMVQQSFHLRNLKRARNSCAFVSVHIAYKDLNRLLLNS
jgi:hypothetical protein